MNKKRIGIFISEIRQKNSLSQEDLSNQLNISLRKLKLMEKGVFMVDGIVMGNMCRIFGISIHELLLGKRNLTFDERNQASIIALDYYKKQKTLNYLFYIIYSLMFIILIKIVFKKI